MFYITLIIIKLLAWALSFFPRKVFLWLGRQLGRILLHFSFRKEIVETNIQLAFPEWDAEKRQNLIQQHYEELGILFLEFLRSFYRFGDFVEKYSDLEGEQNLKDALAQEKGVFVMTAHLGNWEVLSVSGPCFFQTPVTMVTKELKPAFLHRVVSVTRSLLKVHMACEPKTMQGILRALKRKEIVGFVMDQFAGAPVGARVPFFGHPVGSHTALAALARRMGVPVIPAIAYRKPDGRYSLRFDPALPLVEEEDVDVAIIKNTANYVKHTERWIREYPEQWLWIHRRWKGDLSPLPAHCPGEMLK